MLFNLTNDFLNGEVTRATSVAYHLEPLQPYLTDPAVTEICINRPYEVFCERLCRWESHEAPKLSVEHLRSLATAVAKFMDSDISDSRPILSATLPKGERVQIVLPPACEYGTVSLTIRKPSTQLRRLEDYQREGFFTHVRPLQQGATIEEQELLDLKAQGDYLSFLKRAVQLGKVIVVAGETGSGKTTFMKGLIQEIPKDLRIITIEDVPELSLPHHPNHVHLFYPSEAKEEDQAPITPSSLLKSCWRMKPNRILLAELRGGETFDFINVAASGHGGSITSLHAGSAALAFDRAALMVLQNRQGRALPYPVIRQLLYQVIDIVIHIHNSADSYAGRHITEVWYEPQRKRTNMETSGVELTQLQTTLITLQQQVLSLQNQIMTLPSQSVNSSKTHESH